MELYLHEAELDFHKNDSLYTEVTPAVQHT
jgi:hypothetical protein